MRIYIYWRRRKSAKESEKEYAGKSTFLQTVDPLRRLTCLFSSIVEFSSTRERYCSSVYTQDVESVISVEEFHGTQRYNPFQTPPPHVADGNAVSPSKTDGAPPSYARDEKSAVSPISPPPSAVTRQPRA